MPSVAAERAEWLCRKIGIPFDTYPAYGTEGIAERGVAQSHILVLDALLKTAAGVLRSAIGQTALGAGDRVFQQAGRPDGNGDRDDRGGPADFAVLAVHLNAGSDEAGACESRHPIRRIAW